MFNLKTKLSISVFIYLFLNVTYGIWKDPIKNLMNNLLKNKQLIKKTYLQNTKI